MSDIQKLPQNVFALSRDGIFSCSLCGGTFVTTRGSVKKKCARRLHTVKDCAPLLVGKSEEQRKVAYSAAGASANALESAVQQLLRAREDPDERQPPEVELDPPGSPGGSAEHSSKPSSPGSDATLSEFLGRRIAKYFQTYGGERLVYFGKVIAHLRDVENDEGVHDEAWKVRYEDEDTEDFYRQELMDAMALSGKTYHIHDVFIRI